MRIPSFVFVNIKNDKKNKTQLTNIVQSVTNTYYFGKRFDTSKTISNAKLRKDEGCFRIYPFIYCVKDCHMLLF